MQLGTTNVEADRTKHQCAHHHHHSTAWSFHSHDNRHGNTTDSSHLCKFLPSCSYTPGVRIYLPLAQALFLIYSFCIGSKVSPEFPTSPVFSGVLRLCRS